MSQPQVLFFHADFLLTCRISKCLQTRRRLSAALLLFFFPLWLSHLDMVSRPPERTEEHRSAICLAVLEVYVCVSDRPAGQIKSSDGHPDRRVTSSVVDGSAIFRAISVKGVIAL